MAMKEFKIPSSTKEMSCLTEGNKLLHLHSEWESEQTCQDR